MAVADARDDSTGDVEIVIEAPGSAFGNGVPQDANGDGSAAVVIGPNATEFYRFEAPATASGVLNVSLTDVIPGTFDPAVALYDANGVPLAQAHAAGPGLDESLFVSGIVPGATYAVTVLSENYWTAGVAVLDIDFETWDVPATVPPLEHYGPLNQLGNRHLVSGALSLDFVGDHESFRFIRRTAGSTTFHASSAPGIDPLIALYDGSGSLLTVADDIAGTLESLTYSLEQWEVYTVLVQDATNSAAAAVSLLILGSPPPTMPVPLNANGYGSVPALLSNGVDPARADADYYTFTAPVDTNGTLILRAIPTQAYRVSIQLFDAAGDPVGDLYASPSDGQGAVHNYPALTPGAAYSAAVIPHNWEAHPVGGDYLLMVNFMIPDVTPPRVTAFARNGGLNRPDELNTLAFTFSEDVSASVDVADLTLYSHTKLVPIDLTGAIVNWNGGTNTATWDLTGVALFPSFYTATLDAAGITDAAGNPLDGDGDGVGGDDYSTRLLLALPGDADLDGAITMADINLIVAAGFFGVPMPGGSWGIGDFDHDGWVTMADINLVVALGFVGAPMVYAAPPAPALTLRAVGSDVETVDALAAAPVVLPL